MGEFVEVLVLVVLLLCFLIGEVKSDAFDHRYKAGDQVPFYANKVGPFQNPSETYAFYSVPFCLPDDVKEKKLTLGEVLNGDRLVSAPYKLDFLVYSDSQVSCQKRLTREQVFKFRSAVAKDYYMQLYYDDLPLWAFIGMVYQDQTKHRYSIFTHILFEILYSKDRVIEISARTDPLFLADVTEDEEVDVEFKYSMKWKETDLPFEKRMQKYTLSSSFPRAMEIHWFSILNSIVTILILIACIVTFYVRVLKKDIAKYLDDVELADNQEETGWKYLHGDVFRHPEHKCLFAAALGCGTQLLTLTALIMILGLAGVFYPYNRGVLLTALIFLYAFTSGVAGYISVSFYCQLEGTNWVRNLLLTGCLFCGPLFLTFCILNSVAISYGATAAMPLGTVVVICVIWTFLAIPMLLVGGIIGKKSNSEFQAPCPITRCPREVPYSQRWYKGTLPQMVLGGILPFSALYIELYYVFASVWGHRIYSIYSILFIIFIVLLIVTALVIVALTYSQLASEDHQWWWRSFMCGGSTGFFVYGYSLYYYFALADMDSVMQTSFFFGYMACICYGIFLMLGTVGFRVSLLLVRYLYGSIKCE